VVQESFVQPDEEEEESEQRLVHHKRKLPDRAGLQVRVVSFPIGAVCRYEWFCLWNFPCVGLGFDLGVSCFIEEVSVQLWL